MCTVYLQCSCGHPFRTCCKRSLIGGFSKQKRAAQVLLSRDGLQ